MGQSRDVKDIVGANSVAEGAYEIYLFMSYHYRKQRANGKQGADRKEGAVRKQRADRKQRAADRKRGGVRKQKADRKQRLMEAGSRQKVEWSGSREWAGPTSNTGAYRDHYPFTS